MLRYINDSDKLGTKWVYDEPCLGNLIFSHY